MASAISPTASGSAGSDQQPRGSLLRPRYFLFGFIGLMLAYVLVHNESFLFDAKSPEWAHIEPFKWVLLLHGSIAACALVLGAMQFSDRLRQRYVKLHHTLGYIYIAGVFIGAPTGLYIQHVNETLGGTRSFTVETVFQSGIWMITTAIALWYILQGKVQLHRQWMTRSFGTGPLIFVEARVILGITGWENRGDHATEIVVWMCTASSILIADIVLAIQEHLRSQNRRSSVRIAE